MSSTILTNKSAAAFRHPISGKVIYVLFEQTYESNVSPKTPQYGCFAFGEYADVMRLVFSHAAACEGACLRSRAGRIKPENYIEAWKRELNNPVKLDDMPLFPLKLNEDVLVEAKEALTRAGLESQCDRLVGENTFHLYADADLMLALYGVQGPFSPWRILDHSDYRTLGDTSLGPAANGYLGKAKVESPTIVAYKLDDENRLVKINDAPFHHAGWQYSAVGAFIADVACDAEMQQAGSAKKMIPAFRETLNAAPELPMGVRVAIRRITEDASDYARREAGKLAQIAGVSADAERFECALSLFERNEGRQAFKSLAKDQVEWIMPMPAEFIRQTGFYF